MAKQSYKVQVNKANRQPFINLSKKEGWKEGDEISLSLEWGKVHNKSMLEKYYEGNKDRLLELQNKLKELHTSIFKGGEYLFVTEELPQLLGLGELEGGYDEPYMFTNSNFDFDVYGDINGDIYGDVVYYLDDILEARKTGEYNLNDPELFLKTFEECAKVKVIKELMEKIIDKYKDKFKVLCKEYGFEQEEDFSGINSIYTDNKVWLEFFEGRYNSMSIKDLHRENSIDIEL